MHLKYDKNSPLLCDSLTPKDKIIDKKVSSFKVEQPHLNLE